MASPKASLSSRARSLSHGVASMIAGGFGGGGAAGFGGAAAGFGGAGFAGCPAASLPGGGAASEPPGFWSSAISIPCEDPYTYHLRGRVSNCATGARLNAVHCKRSTVGPSALSGSVNMPFRQDRGGHRRLTLCFLTKRQEVPPGSWRLLEGRGSEWAGSGM